MSGVLERVLVVVVWAVTTLFAVTLVKGDGPGSGRVVWAPSAEYGVNSGDLPILAVWLVATVACGVLFWRAGR